MIRARSRGGFTLAEVVIALVVMQIGLAAALGMLALAQRHIRRAKALEVAGSVAAGLADSLWQTDSAAAGFCERSGVTARWAPSARGLRLEVVSSAGDTIRFEGPLPVAFDDVGAGGDAG
jgi:Tfp pilus assembly protein PilV